MKIELKNMKHVYPTGDEALKGINLVIEGTEPVAMFWVLRPLAVTVH